MRYEMATDKELEDQRSRLKGQAEFYNPKNVLRPAVVYKQLRKKSDDEAYASANMRANMVEQEQEARNNMANSRAQYESERQAGDPNALRLSFSEWQKL
jgi:hypothetical protein